MGVRQSRQFRFVQYCDIRDFCHFERSKIVGSADPLWSRETCLEARAISEFLDCGSSSAKRMTNLRSE